MNKLIHYGDTVKKINRSGYMNLMNKTILLLDPDEEIENTVKKVSEKKGFQISKFSSGHEGLRAIPEIRPQLIISVFETTDLNGRSIFIRLINDREYVMYRQIPFIIISEKKHREKFGQELFDMGLGGWYTKPLGSHELEDVIENIFMAHLVQRNRELRKQIKRSEYRYRDLIENANDFIFTLDDEGKFVYLNNRFSPLTGWDKMDWAEKPFLSFIDPDDREHALEHYQEAHHGRARIFEAKIIGKSPESSILSFNITPIFEKGSIVGSIGIARDVTEKKKMEKEILDLKNFNESIIQSMEAGLITTDLEGRLTSMNTGAESILGWEEHSVLGNPITSILNPQEVKILLNNPTYPGSLPYSRETELTTKTGKKIVIGFTTTDRINNQNEKVGTIVSFRDITLLKQMQSEVIRMDRLASLGVLASGIAHEIKNPLAGIKTMAQACDEEFESDDPRKEYLTRIIRQVNRLDDLLKTFFAYARPKKPDIKPHPLSEILREVMNLVRKKMATCGINYCEELMSTLSTVLVDSQQMQQVLLNLILNAIEAMPQGGELKVSASDFNGDQYGMIKERGEIQSENTKTFVRILISDSGMGISPEKLETIFDPFFTTKPSGLGLGLSIVYRIIKEHKGDIRVESQLNRGTTFTIMLPTGAKQ